MECSAQAVDIRARSRLGFAILLWRSISWRTKGNRIFGLSHLEVARNAKIDQVKVPCRSAYDIGWLEIAENDGWLACVQVVKHGAELHANIKNFLNREATTLSPKIRL